MLRNLTIRSTMIKIEFVYENLSQKRDDRRIFLLEKSFKKLVVVINTISLSFGIRKKKNVASL